MAKKAAKKTPEEQAAILEEKLKAMAEEGKAKNAAMKDATMANLMKEKAAEEIRIRKTMEGFEAVVKKDAQEIEEKAAEKERLRREHR